MKLSVLFRKGLAMVLIAVMITPMISMGFLPLSDLLKSLFPEADATVNVESTSSASENLDLTFNVPESIYLKPGSGSFQYFLINSLTAAGATANAAPAAAAPVSFSCQRASSVTLSYEFDYTKTKTVTSENGA